MAPFTVLQVCMGNICRSPMAERLLVRAARELIGERADEVLHVHGGGTGGWHQGKPMADGAARQIQLRGGELGGFRARKLLAEYIDGSDLVLTATAEHLEFALGLRPDAADRTFLLLEFVRLLPEVDFAALPPAAPDPDAVHARGVALVAAVAKARAGRPPQPADELDDPYGRDDAYFSVVADRIEHAVGPLAAALLTSRP
ncbi:MAG TPA: phosphotyrosine protein phosphatase [Micromonosporaceae bacterium]|nr:phosphotyrosine protein phosphatase [Micromonosporaceae bacterium]